MQEFDERDFAFGNLVRAIFPDTQSARVARVGDVTIRTAQKWIAGEADVPADVQSWVEKQHSILPVLGFEQIETIIDQMGAIGVEKEVVAAHLSAMYEKLTGMKIR